MSRGSIVLDAATLKGAVRQVVKNWWVVLAFTLVAFLGMTSASMLTYVPEYTSTATLAIRIKGEDTYSSLAEAIQMTAVFAEVFQSDVLCDAIAGSVGEEVQATVSCVQVPETNLLTLSVTSSSSREAYLLIQSALQNYEEVSTSVFSDAMLQLVQEPSVPESPSNTSTFIKHRAFVALVAGIGSVLLVVAIYLARNTVKTAGQAPMLLDGPILGTIPFERKRRVKTRSGRLVPALVLTSPLVSMAFAEANRRAATRLEDHLAQKGFKAVLVASVGEDEGKSTVASNLAIALAERGKRVLLIDGDLHKPALQRIFGMPDSTQPSFSDYVLNGEFDSHLVFNRNTGVYELFQDKALSDPATVLRSDLLTEAMGQLRRWFDYIFVDCPPVAASADAELWMRQVDTVCLVVRQDRFDVRIINDTADVAWNIAKDFSGFVLNVFNDANALPSGGYDAYRGGVA